jgi:putative membrane protein
VTLTIADALPSINATLNATSAVLLFVGYQAIRTKRIPLHRFAMQGAFVTSAVFLVCYLTRFYLTGTHRFPGGGWLKAVYLTILFTHMVLAVVTVPLVLRTLYLARASRFAEHRKIAKYTFPVWMYVSVTGVIVYVMLYHLA